MPASRVLKSSLLGSAKSDPCLNESRRDKKVHFADTLGLSLVSVLHFTDPPSTNYHRKMVIRPSWQSCERIDRARLLNFVQPLSGKKLIETLDRQAVCLESITIREFGILGNIKVKNLAYEKRLFIRYTLDNWATYQETRASYVYGSSTGVVDTFKFEIAFTEELEKDIKIEFAIRYQVLGTRIWDNNSGDNYRLYWYGSRRFQKSHDVLDIFQGNRYAGFWI